MNELHLFAGAGGGILGGILLGHTTVCAVEIEPYCRKVLFQRQRDGILPKFPIWDDVRTFDGKPWRGLVDVVCGGFPCQDISCAGKGKGITGERSGLWNEFARIIGEVRPRFVFVENSPMLTSRGGARVVGDLTGLGYDSKWGVISAADTGAPHKRERFWIYSNSDKQGLQGMRKTRKNKGGGNTMRHSRQVGVDVSDSDLCGCDAGSNSKQDNGRVFPQIRNAEKKKQTRSGWVNRPGQVRADNVSDTLFDGLDGGEEKRNRDEGGAICEDLIDNRDGIRGEAQRCGCAAGKREPWKTEPGVQRVVNGMAHRVDRLKAIGNGQIPVVAATSWEILI